MGLGERGRRWRDGSGQEGYCGETLGPPWGRLVSQSPGRKSHPNARLCLGSPHPHGKLGQGLEWGLWTRPHLQDLSPPAHEQPSLLTAAPRLSILPRPHHVRLLRRGLPGSGGFHRQLLGGEALTLPGPGDQTPKPGCGGPALTTSCLRPSPQPLRLCRALRVQQATMTTSRGQSTLPTAPQGLPWYFMVRNRPPALCSGRRLRGLHFPCAHHLPSCSLSPPLPPVG